MYKKRGKCVEKVCQKCGESVGKVGGKCGEIVGKEWKKYKEKCMKKRLKKSVGKVWE